MGMQVRSLVVLGALSLVLGTAHANVEEMPPTPVDAEPLGRPAVPPPAPEPEVTAAPAAPSASKPQQPGATGGVDQAMDSEAEGGGPPTPPIPGFPRLCMKPGKQLEKGELIRCVPGLSCAMRELQSGRTGEAVNVLQETVSQMEQCKKQLGLKEGKQAAATRKALETGLQSSSNPAPLTRAVSAALKQSSPILLDLNGNGRADVTTPDYTGDNGDFVRQGAVYFDLSGTGTRRRTEWLTPGQDGLLALDSNGNGLVDDASELFGDSDGFADGYAKLARLDADQDGKLTGSELSQLTAWVDDGDGVCRPTELSPMAALGISSIDVTHRGWASSYVRHGKVAATWDWFPRGE